MKIDNQNIVLLKKMLEGLTIDGFYFTGKSFYIFFENYNSQSDVLPVCLGFTGIAHCYQSTICSTDNNESIIDSRKVFIPKIYDLFGYDINDVLIEDNKLILRTENSSIMIIEDKDDVDLGSWTIYPNKFMIKDEDWIISFSKISGLLINNL